MRPDYVCPICSDSFGRKWNFIRHAKDVHNAIAQSDSRFKIKSSRVSYSMQKSLSGHLAKEAQFNISSAIRKLTKTINDISSGQALAQGTHIPDPYSPLKESELNHVLNNYVLISKAEIQGISANFCEKCSTFQYTYIKEIGNDLLAYMKHPECHPIISASAQGLQDKTRRGKVLRHESIQFLLGLVKNIFGDNVSLKALPLGPVYITGEFTEEEKPSLIDFHSRHYLIGDRHRGFCNKWLIDRAIVEGKIPIDEAYLERFLGKFWTTYFVVSVKYQMPYQHYIVSISG